MIITDSTAFSNIFFYFQYFTYLARHIMYTHETEKPWKCEHCDFAHALKAGLLAHSKGQLISECLIDVLNFPKNHRKNLINICPRI